MSTEVYEIKPSTPVKRPGRQGAGRRAEANPFESAVAEIVGQFDPDGAPMARETTITLNTERGETLKQRASRVRRFLTAAGKTVATNSGHSEPWRITMTVEDGEGTLIPEDEREVFTSGTFTIRFWARSGE